MVIYEHISLLVVFINVDNVYNNMAIYGYSISYRHHSMDPPPPRGYRAWEGDRSDRQARSPPEANYVSKVRDRPVESWRDE
jgi:hypothetical protein